MMGFIKRERGTTSALMYHYASGGFSHFLRLLGESILFARIHNRSLGVVSENHQPLARLPLDRIFRLAEPLKPLGDLPRSIDGIDVTDLHAWRIKGEINGGEQKGVRVSLIRTTDKRGVYGGYLSVPAASAYMLTTGDPPLACHPTNAPPPKRLGWRH